MLLALGAYHGINPGMGWLFAVSLGMQEQSRRAVWRALLPIALGHGAAIAAVVLLAALLGVVMPLGLLKVGVAAFLLAFGAYRLFRSWHPRWGGMQIGFWSLAVWSFLMASAHGAGFMVLPVLFGMGAGAKHPPGHGGHAGMDHAHHAAAGALTDPWVSGLAVLVHTAGYLVVTGLVAWLVYEKLGLRLLRRAWLNLDLIWGVALVVTGVFVLLV